MSDRIRGIVSLTILAIAAAALLAYTNEATRDRIDANKLMLLQQGLRDVLPAQQYDNRPHEDVIYVASPELLGSEQSLPIYRARYNGKPVAAAITAVAPDGYVGHIKLLVAVDMSGRIIAARAVEHSETPGLGDAIDANKSSWMTLFSGRRLASNDGEDWRVRRDGGDIDQITGATVTSRAVVNATRDALHYFARHRDEIFEPASQEVATSN